jgi:MoaA/NifB/PqqE/SkfB family radical SAM enzyme
VYDFANILFAGPCNRFCPWCIGKQVPSEANTSNLDLWPLRGLDGFIAAVNQHQVPQIVLTGTTTDPQLYRHEARLIATLRARLHPGAQLSVHTNGVRALRRMSVFNGYDRACISFPSFVPQTYERLMGSPRVPDLAAILRMARIPVKVSAVVNEHNAPELDSFVAECRRIGVRRLVIRRLYGDSRRWDVLRDLREVRRFRGNRVLDAGGMEVTFWDWEGSDLRSLNLFADGTLGTSYLLVRTPELRRPPPRTDQLSFGDA